MSWGRFWGRGRFSERSASPPDPLSRRAAGVWLVRFCIGGSACECGRSPINLVVVTAADRAAATLRRGGTNPSARFAGTSPFRGGFLCVLKLEGRNVRSTSSPAATSRPQAQALVENGTFSTGPLVRNRREPRSGRPCEAPPTQAACQRGVRGPACRMETSPAPGSLWFLSPAGKELVRPQTHETPSSNTLPPRLCAANPKAIPHNSLAA